MKSKFLTIMVLTIVVVSFSACEKDRENENRDLSYATITDSANKVLTTDVDGVRLNVEENASVVGDWTVGRRVIIDYTKVREDANASVYKVIYIKVNGIYSILTKNPIKLSFLNSTTRVDSIGHDPINLHDVWFANSYININFGLYRNDPGVRHFINLVVDDSKTTSDDAYIELRHNAYFDLQSVSTWGNVSFKISDLIVSPKTSIKLHLSRLTYSGEVKTDTITYNANVSSIAPLASFTRSLVQLQ